MGLEDGVVQDLRTPEEMQIEGIGIEWDLDWGVTQIFNTRAHAIAYYIGVAEAHGDYPEGTDSSVKVVNGERIELLRLRGPIAPLE